MRAGIFRPVTLWPFPSEALAGLAASVRAIVVVELSAGQMIEDVRLAIGGDARSTSTAEWAGWSRLRPRSSKHCAAAAGDSDPTTGSRAFPRS